MRGVILLVLGAVCLLAVLAGRTHAELTWEIETVDTGGEGVDVRRYTSLALDSSDYPHISYYNYTDGDLKYAAWDGSSWNIEVPDSAGSVGYCSSLALDSSDWPHIGYFDSTNGDLKYIYWDGDSWEGLGGSWTVDSTGTVGVYASLALDGSARPHISYYDATSDDLKYV